MVYFLYVIILFLILTFFPVLTFFQVNILFPVLAIFQALSTAFSLYQAAYDSIVCRKADAY